MIGFVGSKRAYLNVSREEALRRFLQMENMSQEDFNADGANRIEEFQFEDEFCVYAAWAT